MDALLDHTAHWIKDGTLPPTATHIELKELPPAEPAAEWAWSTRAALGKVVHDRLRNAHGGIELSQHAVPTATNTGQNERRPPVASATVT